MLETLIWCAIVVCLLAYMGCQKQLIDELRQDVAERDRRFRATWTREVKFTLEDDQNRQEALTR